MIIGLRDEPISNVEEWFNYAKPRGGHLSRQDGRSAKELAKAWCPENGPPGPPADLLALLHAIPRFSDPRFTNAYPERRLRIDDVRGEAMNADLIAHGASNAGRFVLSVEAKADEPFGIEVAEYIAQGARQFANEDTPRGKLARIQGLHRALFQPRRGGVPPFGQLRYQLVTAAAGALAAAHDDEADTALLLIHEFHTHRTRPHRLADNEMDLHRFVARLTGTPNAILEPGSIIGPIHVPGSERIPHVVALYIGRLITSELAIEDLGAGLQPALF